MMYQTKSSIVVWLAALVVLLAGVMAAKTVVLPVIMAVFISVICNQPIVWLEKKRVPYTVSVLIVLLSFASILMLFGSIIGGSLTNFMKVLPKYEANLKQIILSVINDLNALGANINPSQLIDLIDPGKVLSYTSTAVGEIGRIMSDSFIILLITIFILLEAKSFVSKADVIQKLQGTSLMHLDSIGKSIRHYLSIKTMISLLTGVFIWLWLFILGVDFPILWGVIAFFLNYIPSIGSIIAAVPTVLLALVQIGVGGMLWTGLAYLVVNIVMGNVIEPRMMGKGLGLSTFVVFLSLIVWGFIFGPVGMFLSIPLTITLKIMLEQKEETKWIAIMLGSEQETRDILREFKDDDAL
ncbi:AI-2E family transporter [Carboxylicivirga sp. N1Y90]|uniref:AI-2E family transporter n=1 Tax=Carboxylicivirga fragile TaxID=3417571 RepID=UPI003D3334E0|nr:AI-2E family transporter [Marinilabiliaceae bacterium N1Y90]